MAHEDRPDDTYRTTLARAAEILGGAAALSHRLQVPLSDIKAWLAGADRPSMGTFLKVIDILIEEKRTPVRQQQERADRSQAKADRSQARADRDQASADRDQAKADREAHTDGKQDEAGRSGRPSGPGTERLRLVQPKDSDPGSNTPDEESGKKRSG